MTVSSSEFADVIREPSALQLAALGLATFLLVLVVGLTGLSVFGGVKHPAAAAAAAAEAPHR